MKAIGAIVLFLLFCAYSVVLAGYTLSTLWGWFMVPLFAVPQLTIASAAGLALMVNFTTISHIQKREEIDKYPEFMLKMFGRATLSAILALVFGFVIKQWL